MTRTLGRSKPALIGAALLLGGCLPDAEYKQRGPTAPEELDDGWEVATPESVDLDRHALERIHDELLRPDRHFGTLGLLVVKRGKLVFETYLRSPADRDHYQHIQSMTKSVTSLAFGIARDEGFFPDLDAAIGDLLPARVFAGLDPRKGAITVEQLLTMRSGLDFANDVFSVELQVDRPGDPLRYILEKPLFADPGDAYRYRDADPQVVAYLLQHVTSEREEDFVRERLFEPLGIEDYFWESTADGATLGGAGLHLRPRDSAKLGQLLLDCALGRDALVSGEYCELATREHVPSEDTGGKRVARGFGYYFWTLEEYAAFAAWGHGGQYILVVPDQELVLVQIALPDTDFLHGGSIDDFVELTAPLF